MTGAIPQNQINNTPIHGAHPSEPKPSTTSVTTPSKHALAEKVTPVKAAHHSGAAIRAQAQAGTSLAGVEVQKSAHLGLGITQQPLPSDVPGLALIEQQFIEFQNCLNSAAGEPPSPEIQIAKMDEFLKQLLPLVDKITSKAQLECLEKLARQINDITLQAGFKLIPETQGNHVMMYPTTEAQTSLYKKIDKKKRALDKPEIIAQRLKEADNRTATTPNVLHALKKAPAGAFVFRYSQSAHGATRNNPLLVKSTLDPKNPAKLQDTLATGEDLYNEWYSPNRYEVGKNGALVDARTKLEVGVNPLPLPPDPGTFPPENVMADFNVPMDIPPNKKGGATAM